MPRTKNIRHITKNKTNSNLAIPAAAEAMPVNPNTAANNATTKKITAQRNISFYLPRLYRTRERERVCRWRIVGALSSPQFAFAKLQYLCNFDASKINAEGDHK